MLLSCSVFLLCLTLVYFCFRLTLPVDFVRDWLRRLEVMKIDESVNIGLHSPAAWRLRGNTIRTAACWVVWHNVHSQQHTHVSSSYRSSRLGLSHWDPYAMHRGGCLELYYCNMVECPGRIQVLSARPTGFLHCFDTVGLVIWPVKIVPDICWWDIKPCSIKICCKWRINYDWFSWTSIKLVMCKF